MSTRHLEQAVAEDMSLVTMLTLFRIVAKDPSCNAVRYLSPTPHHFGLFIDGPATPADSSSFREPVTLTLNELCAKALPVLEKIAQWDDDRQKAERALAESRDVIRKLKTVIHHYRLDRDDRDDRDDGDED